MDLNVNVKISFEDRFIKVLDGLGKVYTVVQPDKIDAERYEAIKAAEAVQDKEKEEITEKVEQSEEKLSEGVEESSTVPTSAPAYTFEQIQLAAANLARGGKREELANLLKEFGVASLPDLKEDKFDAFALKLRELGGTI